MHGIIVCCISSWVKVITVSLLFQFKKKMEESQNQELKDCRKFLVRSVLPIQSRIRHLSSNHVLLPVQHCRLTPSHSPQPAHALQQDRVIPQRVSSSSMLDVMLCSLRLFSSLNPGWTNHFLLEKMRSFFLPWSRLAVTERDSSRSPSSGPSLEKRAVSHRQKSGQTKGCL